MVDGVEEGVAIFASSESLPFSVVSELGWVSGTSSSLSRFPTIPTPRRKRQRMVAGNR